MRGRKCNTIGCNQSKIFKIGKTMYKVTSIYEKGKTLTEKFEKIIEREIKK